MSASIDDQIRAILGIHGRLLVEVSALRDDDDLFKAGMTSHANVNVMLALESAFEVEFPEHMLRRSTFESVAAIRDAISDLTAEGAVA
jgi:acyl carrier protein